MWGADAFREFYPQVDVEQAEQLLGLPAGTSAVAANKDGSLARIHGLTCRRACCGVIWAVGGLGVGRGMPDSPVCRLLRGSWLSG